MTKPTQADRFLQGYCCALGILADYFNQPKLAAMIILEGGFELVDLIAANVEESDLEKFKEELEKLENDNT